MSTHGINIYLDYHYEPESHDWEPCLFMEKGGRKYAIKQSDAFKFSRGHMEDGQEADLRMVMMADQVLNHLFGDSPEVKGPRRMKFAGDILSAVEDRLDDLIGMPPKPDEEKMIVGEATISVDGGQEMTTELTR